MNKEAILNRLLETQKKKPTRIPRSMEEVIEFLEFTNWPYNLDKDCYRKDINIDRSAAKQIWEAALQKSITASVKPENQLHFLILTLWCLQALEFPEGTVRQIKLGDFLLLDSADQSPVEGQEVGGIGASARL